MKHEYGCLMGMFNPQHSKNIVKFGKTIIPPSILYTSETDDSYGYGDEPHVTVKFGLTPDLDKNTVLSIIKGIKPFYINLHSLSQFKNSEFDVIKFDVESSVLRDIRKKVDKYPNEDSFPDYHPHVTIAYVLPGRFNHIKKNLKISIPVTRFKYSSMTGECFYIDIN